METTEMNVGGWTPGPTAAERVFVLADEGNPEPISRGTRLLWVEENGAKTPAVVERVSVRNGNLWAYIAIYGGHGRNWYWMGRCANEAV